MKAVKVWCVRCRPVAAHFVRTALAALVFVASLCSNVVAAEKPPLVPDTIASFNTASRISATVEFGLSALAHEIEADIPRRLATIDEEVSCVHRRVLVFRVNANCDIWGFIERSGPVSLYGRGDRVYGSFPIHGVLEGQGANRFTARIHGETEARAVIEVEARPKLGRDWSLDLNFSDHFRWSEPPILHVLGREISLAKYAEPRISAELAHVRARARLAARRLDVESRAATAWRHAFEPVQLSDNPATWLQLTPQSVAFAGVRADGKVLRCSLELSASAATFVGQQPPAVDPTPLPALGNEVSQPGEFDVILPVRIGYDVLKDKILQAANMVAPASAMSLRDAEVYPSAGKLVIGLRISKASDTDPSAGQWMYLTGSIQVDADGRAVRLADLGAVTDNPRLASVVDPFIARLRDKTSVDYGIAYQNLLNAASERLTRPLKNGFRTEGHLASAKLEKVYLSADGVVIALHASGALRILYGM
ncbi:MAG TPA: DUF4403 family protein [Pseudolabrys sp.]